MRPYEPDGARIRALYRVPTSPRRNRALELCCNRAPAFAGHSWPGESYITCTLQASSAALAGCSAGPRHGCVAHYDRELPFSPASFDVVILHQTLDDLITAERQRGGAFAIAPFLGRVQEVLAA